MKKFLVLAISFILILALTACGNAGATSSEGEYVKITQEKAKQMMDEGDVVIVDVREQSEFDEGHIKNAKLLPLGEIESRSESFLTDKDAKILVYCRSGRRSAEGAKKLLKLGYKNVFDFGGIIDWQYEIEK